MTYHALKVKVRYLVLRRQAKRLPLIFGDTLVILDDLLRVTAVQNHLYDGLLSATLCTLGELFECIVYTGKCPLAGV